MVGELERFQGKSVDEGWTSRESKKGAVELVMVELGRAQSEFFLLRK